MQRRDREVVPDEGYQVYPGVNLLEERDRQRRQLGEELRKIEREIEASEGYRLHSRMNLLEKSYFVFDANYLNLKHILDEFEQPMVFLKLWEERTRDRFDLFIDDVIRLFHNYLAGRRRRCWTTSTPCGTVCTRIRVSPRSIRPGGKRRLELRLFRVL